MPGEKTSKAELIIRVEAIVSLIIMGLTRKEMLQYISKQAEKEDPGWTWNVSERTIDAYMQRARKEIEKISDYKKDYEIGLGLTRLEDLYKRSISIQDYKAALAVQKERHELLGIKAKDPLVNINVGSNVTIFELPDNGRSDGTESEDNQTPTG